MPLLAAWTGIQRLIYVQSPASGARWRYSAYLFKNSTQGGIRGASGTDRHEEPSWCRSNTRRREPGIFLQLILSAARPGQVLRAIGFSGSAGAPTWASDKWCRCPGLQRACYILWMGHRSPAEGAVRRRRAKAAAVRLPSAGRCSGGDVRGGGHVAWGQGMWCSSPSAPLSVASAMSQRPRRGGQGGGQAGGGGDTGDDC